MQNHNVLQEKFPLARKDSLQPLDSTSLEEESTPAMDSGSSSDYDDDNAPDPWHLYTVNLSTFESFFKHKPIYTHALLLSASKMRKAILAGTHKGEWKILDAHDQYQVIWAPPPCGKKVRNIEILFLNHTEMSPEYALQPGSPPVELLRQYAGRSDLHATSPIVLRECPLYGDEDHLDPQWMRCWTKQLGLIRTLWLRSAALKKLRDTISIAAKSCIRIKKIACFGLGDFRTYESGSFGNSLQYCVVFSIAGALNAIYAAQDAGAEPVQLFFQDPCYSEKDRLLIEGAGYKGKITLVQNPDGFLQVDQHTLVVGAYLPVSVPLVQICTEVAGKGGPAGFIVDKMVLDKEKKHFTLGDRASMRVVNVLKGYDKYGFEDHVLDEDLVKKTLEPGGYWLKKMEMLLKPEV